MVTKLPEWDITQYIVKVLPKYGYCIEQIEKANGHLMFKQTLYDICDAHNINDYPKYYLYEPLLRQKLINALLSPEQQADLTDKFENATAAEATVFLNAYLADFEPIEKDINNIVGIVHSAKGQKATSNAELGHIGETQAHFADVFAYFMVNFHNLIALMVHGKTMSQLVKEAIAGDDKALVLAAQIDPSVMRNIDYFTQRQITAERQGDSKFLQRLSYRMQTPTWKGKIKYPLLYLLFALLEQLELLDHYKHEHILDLCDAASLDLWQNRIEDVGYLNKRLRDYRQFQKQNTGH